MSDSCRASYTGGDFDRLVLTLLTGYSDTDVEPGRLYEYQTTSWFGGREDVACATASVIAVPELPSPMAMALAAAGGLAGYAVIRRRR